MSKKTVSGWKQRIIKEAAKEYSVKPQTIRIVPVKSKRPIFPTWKLLQHIFCPINNLTYRIYSVRTIAEFREAANSGM